MGMRLTANGKPDRRNQKRVLHLAKLLKLLQQPRSVEACRKALGCKSTRNIYFMFHELERQGHQVARIGSRTEGRWVLLGA